MKKKRMITLLLLCICMGCAKQKQSDPIQYVDPMIGTLEATVTDKGAHTAIEHGRVVPMIGVPHGMTSWVPQTAATENKCVCPYYYKHNKIEGFRSSHWINGGCTQDYGSITIMPISGELKVKPEERASTFSHDREEVSPAHYSVFLEDYGITASMTGLSRSAVFSFNYTEKDDRYVVIDINSDEGEGYIVVDPASRTISGYNPVHRIYNGWGNPAGFSGYFVITCSEEFDDFGCWSDWELNRRQAMMKGNGHAVGTYLHFPAGTDPIQLRIGTSFVSIEEAENNLKAETGSETFASVREKAGQAWSTMLNRIQLEGGTEEMRVKFYSALYRTALLPRQYNDVSGSYPRFASDYQTAHLPKGNYYDDFSIWDTYRALHPLYTILSPALTLDFVKSLIIKAEQGEWLPIFPCWNSYTSAMVGDHATAVIADAYSKGITKFDIQKAYTYMRKNAFDVNPDFSSYQDGKGRRALASYLQYGYIPMEDSVWEAPHKCEQVSRTLEYAYDDFALAQVALRLGKEADYATLMERSGNYRNVYDTVSGYVRGRHADGTWISPFDPLLAKEPEIRRRFITEGSAFQYSWSVPHDVEGLVTLMGGKAAFAAKLDRFFADTHYWHGNEPSHHIAYLYTYIGEAWKTQALIPDITERYYRTTPDGLTGNDDAGQLSAWLVFSMMGFYPVCPGVPTYAIGTPMFPKISIRLENDRVFTVEAKNVSPVNRYIQSAELNGEPYHKSYITHEDIMSGATLSFVMGSQPNKMWGTAI